MYDPVCRLVRFNAAFPCAEWRSCESPRITWFGQLLVGSMIKTGSEISVENRLFGIVTMTHAVHLDTVLILVVGDLPSSFRLLEYL